MALDDVPTGPPRRLGRAAKDADTKPVARARKATQDDESDEPEAATAGKTRRRKSA